MKKVEALSGPEGDEIKHYGIFQIIQTRRFSIAVLLLLAVLMQYAAKLDLSVNIVCMTNHSAKCVPGVNSTCKPSDQQDGPFTYGKAEEANLLAAFFYGYLISEVPGGILAQRFGSKLVLGGAVVLNSICAWHYAPAALRHIGIFIFLRILVGFGCGMMLPATSNVWTTWAPVSERTFLIGLALSGAYIAPIIVLPLGGALCGDPVSDWKNMFYVVASLETLWIILWFVFYSNHPSESLFITEREVEYINATVGTHDSTESHENIPWNAIFTSRACWTLFLCHTFANWGVYTLLTEIPSYMKQILEFNIRTNGLYSAFPYMLMWVTTTVGSYLADILMDKKIFSRTVVRKIAVGIGTFVPAIFLTALGFMKKTQRNLAVALLTIGQGMFGVAWGAGHMCNANDLAPVHAGVLFGISNTFATIPGILTPYVTAAITEKGTRTSWQIVFGISSVFFVLAGVVFILFGDGRVQEWDSDHVHPRSARPSSISTRAF